MAFTGKLAGVSGRKMFFGERLKNEQGLPTNHWEHEFTLAQDGKVVRGEATGPDFDPAHLSDLKNGMGLRLCGVPVKADGEPCCEAHTVIIVGPRAKSRERSREIAEREERRAAKSRR